MVAPERREAVRLIPASPTLLEINLNLYMPERNQKIRRNPPWFAGRRNPALSFHHCRSKPRPRKSSALRVLSRSSSEPTLWTVRIVSDDDDDSDPVGLPSGTSSGILLPRLHTWTHIFSPSPSLQSPTLGSLIQEEEALKVVVSVTVEGSPGPVRTMVRLGASVDEAIGLVVDKYGKEGRSPRLDRQAAHSFQLHYSHFSLQSLNKKDKIGEVGGRSFYLRKSSPCSSSSNGFNFGREGSEMESMDGRPQAVGPPTHPFFSCLARRLNKIRRRTRKLWKVVVCITCG